MDKRVSGYIVPREQPRRASARGTRHAEFEKARERSTDAFSQAAGTEEMAAKPAGPLGRRVDAFYHYRDRARDRESSLGLTLAT